MSTTPSLLRLEPPDASQRRTARLLSQLRRRWWLVVAPVVIALVVAAVYVKTATPVYEAQANLLLTPTTGTTSIPGLIPESADPTRDAQTAASVVSSPAAAAYAKRLIHDPESPNAILAHISVSPVANANILAVTAKASTASGAARLANAYAAGVIATRTASFHAAVDQQIAAVQAQIAKAGTAAASATTSGTGSLYQQLAQLETLRAGRVPDMSISRSAVPPSGRSSPRASLSLAAGGVAGLVIGILALLAAAELDRTLRTEDELKDVFRLPILARIPREPSRREWARDGLTMPRSPDTLSAPALEAFRTMRAMTLVPGRGAKTRPHSILVTSAAPSEGKTTTALNLAYAMSSLDAKVIVIEADLRRPSLGRALDLLPPYDTTAVLTGMVGLGEALVSSRRFPRIRFLLAQGVRSNGDWGADALFLPSVRELLAEAQAKADIVIIDAPPLLSVIDALELARQVDSVVLVAQLGVSHLGRLEALRSLLEDAHIRPAGVALIGAELPGGAGAYEYAYWGAVGTDESVNGGQAARRTSLS